MQIDVKATDRLKGDKALDLAPVMTALSEAIKDSTLDLTNARVVMDWVQYRQSFRGPVDTRAILPGPLDPAMNTGTEIAVDLRRAGSASLGQQLAAAFAPKDGGAPRQYLEDWTPGKDSCIWSFNGLYWNALGLWEEATGREYEQALPGGESDARNADQAREIILELFKVWDNLAARHALPEDLHVLELGVGNGNQARVWLDEFQKLDRERGGGQYYRRLHYLMADYSAHVLERARENVKAHAERCSSLAMDARVPTQTLGFLRGKAFLVYISNVYDNLPTDEIVRIGGHMYQVEVRAFIPPGLAKTIGEEFNVAPDALPDLIHRLLALGPDLLSKAATDLFPKGNLQAVEFWQKVWDAVRLEERYVPIEGLDSYRVTPTTGGEVLRPLVEANGDVRMHVSNGAAASFLDSLPLLHPFGILQCLDIFVTEMSQYSGFRGPGKYDGSVVNWVNGPLLAAVARRHGYDAHYQTFNRQGSNIITLTARIQE